MRNALGPESGRACAGRIVATVEWLLVAACVSVLALWALGKWGKAPSAAGVEPVRVVEGWMTAVAGRHTLGSAAAPIRITVFTDYQCPFCAREHGLLKAAAIRHPADVAITFRHFPLDRIHPHAVAAALAAECAGEQGSFLPFADALFQWRDSIGVIPWSAFAERAELRDPRGLDKCVATERYRTAVLADRDLALALGLRATPSVLVNGRLLPGTPSADVLEREIALALESQRSNLQRAK